MSKFRNREVLQGSFYKDISLKEMLREVSLFRRLAWFLRSIQVISRRNPIVIWSRQFGAEKVRVAFEVALFPTSLGYFFFRTIQSLCYERQHRNGYRYELAIATIIKNEGFYIEEWVAYHRLIGVAHIYIFDNESNDNTESILKKYVDQGYVSYIKMYGRKRQHDAYNTCINRYSRLAKYIAFIDADEFICCSSMNGEILHHVEKLLCQDKIGGIGLNWCMFGSSHHEIMPEGLVLESYLYCAEKDFESNRHIKTIANPRKLIGFCNAHFPLYLPPFKSTDVDGVYFNGSSTVDVKFYPLRLNHYFTKSKQEFMVKISKGYADKDGFRPIENFEKFDRNEIYDDTMKTYVSKITRIIKDER